ncbi:MAG TPA: hypothetical protein VN783_04210 [Thermoanaerobaculia bacterium]|nr:hypothetical protein [Thermoanaerobaculia bacterium]
MRVLCARPSNLWILILTAAAALAALPPPASAAASPPVANATRVSRDPTLLDAELACPVDPARELFITPISVVEDCFRTTWTGICQKPVQPATRGAWTFGKLMEGLAGTTDPAALSKFTLNWLGQWKVAKVVNGDTVPARINIDSFVIQPWLLASGGSQLDMKKAPFRLLAIVARLDLRQNAGYSSGTTAGEGRFVFNLLDAAGNTTQFLAILEYGLDAADCNGVLNWANIWHALGSIPFGPNYNAALQSVTDRFTSIGASPNKPNRSALNQLRTNEIFLASPWELREFRLSALSTGTTAPLELNTVAQTPRRNLQNTQPIADFTNANEAAILAGTHVVPLLFNGSPFRGAAARHSLEQGWDGPLPSCTSITNPEARHLLSLNTCSGCHGSTETGTVFKHVEPRNLGSPSQLSTFLAGGGGAISDLCGLNHQFSDIERRRVDLCQLLRKSCAQIDAEPAVIFVH